MTEPTLTTASSSPDEHPLIVHADYELRKLGFFDDPDIKFVADSVMEIMHLIIRQDHCLESAQLLADFIPALIQYEPLSDITSDPSEWMDVSDEFETPGLFQSTRCPNVFSLDGGQTWNYVSEEDEENDINNLDCDCEECQQFRQRTLDSTELLH